jgi:hypothetical protein
MSIASRIVPIFAVTCVGIAQAAPTTYAFDTVTSLQLDRTQSSIAGIEKDTGTNITVNFVDQTNAAFQYVVNRCVPLFVTALEKPGRYFLYVTVNPTEPNVQLVNCRLEIKQ